MGSKKYLIVNADDFGQSSKTNRGIIQAHKHGVVTSASLMVRWPAAIEAAAYGHDHPSLSLGIHIDLGEWRYQQEAWIPVYEVTKVHDRVAVAKEVSNQLAAFRRLVGSEPSHIDSHQHSHLNEPLRTVLLELSRQLGIPLRHCSPAIRYCGDFYGQTAEGVSLPDRISVAAFLGLLEKLEPGVTELGCHPGYPGDLNTMYQSERELEIQVLCDSRVRAAITSAQINLCSFLTAPHVNEITQHGLSNA